MNEFDIIAELFSPLAGQGAIGLKDDAAVLAVPQGSELIITTDALVEKVHFIGNESADLIARKALRTNLSDLAAMGATPYGYFLALILPESVTTTWLTAFAAGLKEDQTAFGIALLGGDTTRTSGPLSISITALGLSSKGQVLRRSGAKTGDTIYVSGTIGDSALGLQIAKKTLPATPEDAAFLLQRYQLPEPRLKLGIALHSIATACMDISDGLVQDLGHICKCSSAGADIFWPQIPLSAAAHATAHSPEMILAGGDDYELLFTAPPQAATTLQTLSEKLDIPITCIGTVTDTHKDVRVLDSTYQEMLFDQRGYLHFQNILLRQK